MDPIFEKLSELAINQREMSTTLAGQQRAIEKHSDLLEKNNETLLRNTITVEDHARRSDLLEQEQKGIKSELDEIKQHVDFVKGVGYFIKWTGIAVGAMASIYAFIRNFRG